MDIHYRKSDGINSEAVSFEKPLPVAVMPDSPFNAISAIAIATPGGAASHSYVVGDTQPLVGGTYTEQGIATVTATLLAGVSVNAAGTGYAPADKIVPTGGTQTVAAELTVVTTKLITAAVNAAGTGYAPGQTITGTGATATTKPVFNVTHTKAVTAVVAAGGTGGTPGAVTLTATTGTGTKFQATGTIGGDGILAGALVVSVAGDYTVNPTDVTVEPVTGGSLTGATVLVGMGVLTATIGNAGVFTANPAALTQDSTSGTGTGATFNTLVFGVNTISISGAGAFTANSATFTQGSSTGGGTGATFNAAYYGVQAATASEPGTYSIVPTNPVSQESSSGAGTGATFTLTFAEKPSAVETLLAALAALMGGAGAATATIAYNPAATTSGAIDVTNHFPGGFHVVAVPSSGYLSLSVSADVGAHYGLLNVDGAQVIIAAAAGKFYGLGSYAGSLQGITHIKFVNVDATGAAANQATADATIIVSRA